MLVRPLWQFVLAPSRMMMLEGLQLDLQQCRYWN